MTSKERMMLALHRQVPDRVPATVHQWQPYHLDKYLGGIDALSAFLQFELDASITCPLLIENESPQWQIDVYEHHNAKGYLVQRITITTPGGTLNQTIEQHPMTPWTTEYLVKKPEDVDLIDKYMPLPYLDREGLSHQYGELGDAGIMRGFVWGDQVGCWQHACCLFGLENLILATYDDPDWVRYFLNVLLKKKLRFIERNLPGAKYDLIETGGGAGSSTCISPTIHRDFCLPWDRQIHDALHELGFLVVYHTCGGMMPILDLIVANGCDACETLTPPGMGGDARTAEIKQRIGHKVCLIGGINQLQALDHGTPASIREEVHRLFDDFGPGGGYIMSPSDHFFETPVKNLDLYARAAKTCTYR